MSSGRRRVEESGQKIRNPPRTPGKPFDLFSPRGRKHYQVTFSTGTPYRCAPLRPDVEAGMNAATLRRQLQSRLAVCEFEWDNRPIPTPSDEDLDAALYNATSNLAFAKGFLRLAKHYQSIEPGSRSRDIVKYARAAVSDADADLKATRRAVASSSQSSSPGMARRLF